MLKDLQRRFVAKFIRIESFSGILLFAMTIIALIWANSSWADSYNALWNYQLGIKTEDFGLVKPLRLWINDGLMAIFFFLIGLEIKRELSIGELNTRRKAVFPFFAALGGMSVPALLYVILNTRPETASGWAIPMATDIAFSLAILKLLGKRVPLNLKIFLTAFAIVDDLGAVMIIALFYSSGIKWVLILSALALTAVLLAISKRAYSKYLLVIAGVVVWYLFLKGGIHPTIAGVLLAFTVPIRQKVDISRFSQELDRIMDRLRGLRPDPGGVLTREQIEELDNLDDLSDRVQSPLQHLEHSLHDWVAYFVMPVFALANAGVAISAEASLDYSLVLIIAAALVIGNPIGISTLTFTAVKLGLTKVPEGVSRSQIIGVSFLAGVGFTMSIFIGNLAFSGSPLLLDSSKVGILLGSFVSGLIGFFILRMSGRKGGG